MQNEEKRDERRRAAGGISAFQPATKIHVIEDAEATGETASATISGVQALADSKCRASSNVLAHGLTFCARSLSSAIPFTSRKGTFPGAQRNDCELCLVFEPVPLLTGQPCLLPACSGSSQSMRRRHRCGQAGWSGPDSGGAGTAGLCEVDH